MRRKSSSLDHEHEHPKPAFRITGGIFSDGKKLLSRLVRNRGNSFILAAFYHSQSTQHSTMGDRNLPSRSEDKKPRSNNSSLRRSARLHSTGKVVVENNSYSEDDIVREIQAHSDPDPTRLAQFEATIQKLKLEFDSERDRIMQQLPDSYQSRFGEVVFGKFARGFYPAMIISPFDAPSGDPFYVREKWMTMFEKLKRQDRLENLSYLVYWYGHGSDSNICFDLIASKDFLPYHEGQRKGCEAPYVTALQRKCDGRQLSIIDQGKAQGMEEINVDLSLEQNQRNRRKVNFDEPYEGLELYHFMEMETPSTVDEVAFAMEKELQSPKVQVKEKRERERVAINEPTEIFPAAEPPTKQSRVNDFAAASAPNAATLMAIGSSIADSARTQTPRRSETYNSKICSGGYLVYGMNDVTPPCSAMMTRVDNSSWLNFRLVRAFKSLDGKRSFCVVAVALPAGVKPPLLADPNDLWKDSDVTVSICPHTNKALIFDVTWNRTVFNMSNFYDRVFEEELRTDGTLLVEKKVMVEEESVFQSKSKHFIYLPIVVKPRFLSIRLAQKSNGLNLLHIRLAGAEVS